MTNEATKAHIKEFGEAVHIRGFAIVAEVSRDEHMGEPWKEHDGHGIISAWTSCEKAPGERVLITDRNEKRYYDMQATMSLAKKDSWDAPPYGGAPGEKAARAVERDFNRMRAWCHNEWYWVCVTVTASRAGIRLGSATCGGLESDDDDGLIDIANELVDEAIDEAKKKIAAINNEEESCQPAA